jgi:tetratricopeptide (TPR) repeat protein
MSQRDELDALVRLAELREGQDDLAGAAAVYGRIIETAGGNSVWQAAADDDWIRLPPWHENVRLRWVAQAALSLGRVRERLGDAAEAAAAYRIVLAVGGYGWGDEAAVRLGLLSETQGDLVGAAEAYEYAADSGDRGYGAQARQRLKRLEKLETVESQWNHSPLRGRLPGRLARLRLRRRR